MQTAERYSYSQSLSWSNQSLRKKKITDLYKKSIVNNFSYFGTKMPFI